VRAACASLLLAFAACGCGEDKECSQTTDCPGGQHCANGRCGSECDRDDDCPGANLVCDDRGRCIPGAGDADSDTDADTDTDTDVDCELPFTECDGLCTFLETDPDNCGACAAVCDPQGEAPDCVDADCVCGFGAACAGTDADRCCLSGGSRSCVDTTADTLHCGSCNAACASTTGPDCVAGECTCGAGPACTGGADDRCCDLGASSRCIDTTTDVAHCGGCGNDCNLDVGLECAAGFCRCGADGACAGTDADRCCDTAGAISCIDTTRSRVHCGSCGVACDAGADCYQGDCQCGCEDDDDCDFTGDGVTCDLTGATDDCDLDGLDEGTCI